MLLVEVVKGIIGYGLLLSRYGKDGATNTLSSFLFFSGLTLSVVTEVVLVVVTVVVEVVVTSKVTGRSLVSIILVEEMELLRNLEVISLTFRGLTAFTLASTVVVVKAFDTVGFGVIGILLVDIDFWLGVVQSEMRSKIGLFVPWEFIKFLLCSNTRGFQ